MKPINQSIIDGDCFRACIASILEVELDKIPNFMAAALDGPDFFETYTNRWLETQPFMLIDLIVNDDEEMRETVERTLRGCYVIATGKSPRGTDDKHMHAVVWKDGKMVHDPCPGGLGIEGKPSVYTIFVYRATSQIPKVEKWR